MFLFLKGNYKLMKDYFTDVWMKKLFYQIKIKLAINIPLEPSQHQDNAQFLNKNAEK